MDASYAAKVQAGPWKGKGAASRAWRWGMRDGWMGMEQDGGDGQAWCRGVWGWGCSLFGVGVVGDWALGIGSRYC